MDFEIPNLVVDNVIDLSAETIRNNPPEYIRTERQLHYYRTMYDQIKLNGTVIEKVDSAALGMLAVNLALVDSATAAIQNDGFNIEVQGDRNTITKKNPALDVLKDAQTNVKFYLAQFKMTPASRTKQLSTGSGRTDSSDGFEQV